MPSLNIIIRADRPVEDGPVSWLPVPAYPGVLDVLAELTDRSRGGLALQCVEGGGDVLCRQERQRQQFPDIGLGG